MPGCDVENVICTGSFYRWTLKIEQHVSGPKTSETLKAVMLQHGEYIFAYKKSALYVISPIDDKEKRAIFGADFYIEEYAPPRKLYCVSNKDKDYNVEGSDEIYVSFAKGCFVRPGEI